MLNHRLLGAIGVRVIDFLLKMNFPYKMRFFKLKVEVEVEVEVAIVTASAIRIRI